MEVSSVELEENHSLDIIQDAIQRLALSTE